MTGKEYVELAMRTNDKNATKRLRKMMDQEMASRFVGINKPNLLSETENIGEIVNGCFGLAGESGETLDLIKKWIFHEKTLDKEHLKEELGDVMWYIAMICHGFDFDLDEILELNIKKLKTRYPEGFEPQKANDRAEKDV